MAFCFEKTHPSSFFSQSEASASLGRVDDVIRMECDQSATRASPSPIIHQSATSDVIGVKGQVDDEGMGLRGCGRGRDRPQKNQTHGGCVGKKHLLTTLHGVT